MGANLAGRTDTGGLVVRVAGAFRTVACHPCNDLVNRPVSDASATPALGYSPEAGTRTASGRVVTCPGSGPLQP